MTELNILAFAAIYAISVASPGPGIALVVSRSLGRGLTGLPWFLLGFVVGDLVLMGVAVLGLAFIAQSFGTVFLFIRWAGVCYLLWLAYKFWTAPAKPLDVNAETKSETPLAAFLSSLALTLGNPKAITFFVSIMPLAVDMTRVDLMTFAELAIVATLVMTPILTAYAVVGDRARRVFQSETALRRINRTSAVGIAGAAIVVATR